MSLPSEEYKPLRSSCRGSSSAGSHSKVKFRCATVAEHRKPAEALFSEYAAAVIFASCEDATGLVLAAGSAAFAGSGAAGALSVGDPPSALAEVTPPSASAFAGAIVVLLVLLEISAEAMLAGTRVCSCLMGKSSSYETTSSPSATSTMMERRLRRSTSRSTPSEQVCSRSASSADQLTCLANTGVLLGAAPSSSGSTVAKRTGVHVADSSPSTGTTWKKNTMPSSPAVASMDPSELNDRSETGALCGLNTILRLNVSVGRPSAVKAAWPFPASAMLSTRTTPSAKPTATILHVESTKDGSHFRQVAAAGNCLTASTCLDS
mmetsp:Transcript_22873/g.51732  ORF Transcript_22873/g.51732 Transcript_22873/m.51732 type:complete len:321 (-) Transcript_22873:1538-2500(-)